jgi:phage I-like protein
LKAFKVENGSIFARVEWTAEAAEAVKGKKYRYVSPVFEHAKDGSVERILRAALTNNPALIELPALAHARTQTPPPLPSPMSRNGAGNRTGVARMAKKDGGAEKSLSEIVAGLEELFPDMSHKQILSMAMGALDGDGDLDGGGEDPMAAGDDPYEHEDAEQMASRQAEEMAKCASDEDKTTMAAKHADQKERFAKRVKGLEVQNRNEKMAQNLHPSLSRKGAGEGLSAAIAKHPMVVRMAGELNQMRASQAKSDAVGKVDAAIREGRLVPSQREWAIEYCSADPQGFEKFIGAQPKIIQAGADGTFTGRIGEAPADAVTQKELAICQKLGITAEKFVAAKKARLSHNATLIAD